MGRVGSTDGRLVVIDSKDWVGIDMVGFSGNTKTFVRNFQKHVRDD